MADRFTSSLLLILGSIFFIAFAITFSAAQEPLSSSPVQEQILYGFKGSPDGKFPKAGLISDPQGHLYGATYGGGPYSDFLGTIFALSPVSGGWMEQILFSFDGLNGAGPSSNLIFDAAGNLYGVSEGGGTSGAGAVFELSRDDSGQWQEAVLYSFTGGADGATPIGSLVFDKNGNLYGATHSGGDFVCDPMEGCGVVFELTPNAGGQWTEKVLHTFNGGDGYGSNAAMIIDAAGNLYGTSVGIDGGGGTVFRLSPSNGNWKLTNLYVFPMDGSHGSVPYAPLVADKKGNLYGTTNWGGSGTSCPGNCGTVFELVRVNRGWTQRVLHNFQSGQDGAYPWSPVTLDSEGNVYGTTASGGGYNASGCYLAQYYCGTVFRLKPASDGTYTETILYRFGRQGDGGSPFAGLLVANGRVYGTTYMGGSSVGSGLGTVFELSLKRKVE